MIKKHTILIIALILIGVVSWNMKTNKKASLGAAPDGMKTIVASSTIKASVGPELPTTIFSASSDCTARVITTAANAIMVTFATSTDLDQQVLPTGSFGHIQLASTTVSYDSGTYGCDVWQAYGYTGTTTISLSEFKGAR